MKIQKANVIGFFQGLVLWGGATGLLGLAMWLFANDKTGSASASSGFGIVLLVFANLDRIESFKGFGMEAKTRELKKAIDDADSTLAKFEAMSAELRAQAESINVLQLHLDETNTIAVRARNIARMAL